MCLIRFCEKSPLPLLGLGTLIVVERGVVVVAGAAVVVSTSSDVMGVVDRACSLLCLCLARSSRLAKVTAAAADEDDAAPGASAPERVVGGAGVVR